MLFRSHAVVLGLCFCFLSGISANAEFTVTVVPPSPSGWRIQLGPTDVAGEAGSDLKPSYDTGTGGETISVGGTAGSAWQLLIKRADGKWNGDLVLQAQVINPGTGSGTISAPSQFLTVTDTYYGFFSGDGDRNNILVRLRISGISIQRLRAENYSTDLVYTIITGK